MKTKIKYQGQYFVYLSYDVLSIDDYGYDKIVRVEREFYCSPFCGYVYEDSDSGRQCQVCYDLDTTGGTLYCMESEELVNIIRREYKSMRKEHAKEIEKHGFVAGYA